ncbi:hypothetical protein M405DRAFT_827196, partial [Rhizopogon salebrosus TDB-379]
IGEDTSWLVSGFHHCTVSSSAHLVESETNRRTHRITIAPSTSRQHVALLVFRRCTLAIYAPPTATASPEDTAIKVNASS